MTAGWSYSGLQVSILSSEGDLADHCHSLQKRHFLRPILGRPQGLWVPYIPCVSLAQVALPMTVKPRSQIRNISRSIWIHVATPPQGAPPPGIKGKTPLNDVTPQQLRHRKIEAIHLALSDLFILVGFRQCLTIHDVQFFCLRSQALSPRGGWPELR